MIKPEKRNDDNEVHRPPVISVHSPILKNNGPLSDIIEVSN